MALSGKELRIITLLVIDTVFFLLELIIGYMVNSLALIADSFHMLNDIISLVVALWAVNVAKNRSADAEYTYGWLRAEILGALINAVFLIALCFTILIEALQRLIDPPVITNAKLILIVGACGLASNIIGLFLFHEHGHSHGGMGDEEGGHSHSHGGSFEDTLIEEDSEDTHPHAHDHSHVNNHDHDNAHSNAHTRAHASKPRSKSIYSTHVAQSSETAPLLESPTDESSNDVSRLLPSYVVGQLDSRNNAQERKERNKNKNKHQKSLNMQGVFLHVLGDALGNVGVMLTAVFIWKTNYSWRYYSDPIISLVITCIIFSSALPLCKRSSRILLQGTPPTVDTSDVFQDILQIPSVLSVHDFHIWNLTEKLLIASLHVELDSSPDDFLKIASEIKSCLHDYGIHSATIQPEFSAYYKKQHMLPNHFASSQNLAHDYLQHGSTASLNSTFNISNTHADHSAETSPTTAAQEGNEHGDGNDIHCLIDASANCTTKECLN